MRRGLCSSRVPLRPVHKRRSERAARGGTCVRVSRGRSRGELGRSSARFSRELAGGEKTPQTEAAIAEGKDFVLLCGVVSLCVFCAVIHRRVSAGAARPRRPPLREVVFCRKWRHRPLVSCPAAAARHREILSEGLPGSLRKPPSLPGTRPAAFPVVFLQAVGRLGRDLAPRKDAQRWEAGHRVLCAKRFLLAAKERWHGRPRNAAGFFVFVLFAGLPRHRYRGESTSASAGMLHVGFVCVFNSG